MYMNKLIHRHDDTYLLSAGRNFIHPIVVVLLTKFPQRYTLAAGGLEEPCVSFPDICNNCSSRLLSYFISKNFWFTIHMDSWLWRKFDRICWACAIFRWIPNLQACTDGRINLGGGWVTYSSSRLILLYCGECCGEVSLTMVRHVSGPRTDVTYTPHPCIQEQVPNT